MRRTVARTRALARRMGGLDRSTRMAMAAVLTVSGAGAGSLVWATSASAAVPVFPDNIVVFPNRDFISVDGFDDHVGRTATVTVTRPGVGVVGAAQAEIAGGSPSFEINHPGGACWGNYAGAPKVTPDILPGDVVNVSVGDTDLADTTTLSGTVATTADGPSIELSGSTLTIRGTLGPDVNLAQVEQRIIAPELRDTEVARRDVRALPGPLTPDPRGGYSSGLTISEAFNGVSRFVATYEFQNASTAAIAAAGGSRLMSWQVEDADANRQGLTIAEFGELGGPGMGGCPNGPLQAGPAAPSGISAVQQSNGDIKFVWTPATAVPGTPAVTGYRVRVWEKVALAPAVENEVGRRINDPASTGVTITGLDKNKDYDIEVSSLSGAGPTFPPATPALVRGDVTGPVVSTSPGGTSFPAATDIALTSNEANSDIYYALWDPTGAAPKPVVISGGTITDAAVAYTGTPLRITRTTTIIAAAFDQAGNLSQVFEFPVTITQAAKPGAPTGVSATGTVGGARISWTAPDGVPADAPVTKYTVRAYDNATASGTPVKTVNVDGDVLTTTVSGLTTVAHTFTVTATNAAGEGPASSPPALTTPQADVVAVAVADQTATRPLPNQPARTVNLSGAGSSTGTGVAYSWAQDRTVPGSNQGTFALTGATTLTPSFSLPAPTGAALGSTAPIYFKLSVTSSGVTRTATTKVTIATDTASIATARFRAGQELRITGSTSSAPGAATLNLYYRNASNQLVLLGAAPLTAAAAPATGSTYDFRLKPPPALMQTGNPVFAFTTNGGMAGPFTPSN